MKITKKYNDGIVNFSTLEVGDTFMSDNIIYLRIDDIIDQYGELVNAISFDSGDVIGFGDNDRVKVVQTELIVDY
jgi:hypothetical protein